LTHAGDNGFNKGGFTPVWSNFRSFLTNNHPTDVFVMYVVDQAPSYTPESIALWEQYTNEFVASVTNTTMP
jgi:hypothetical protein